MPAANARHAVGSMRPRPSIGWSVLRIRWQGVPEEPGIVPLAVAAIFDRISGTQDREFLARVSYMEVGPPLPPPQLICTSLTRALSRPD